MYLQLQLQKIFSAINICEFVSFTDPEGILYQDSLRQTNEYLVNHVAEDLLCKNEVVQSLADDATSLEITNASALDDSKHAYQTSIHIRKDNITIRNATSTRRAKINLLRKEKKIFAKPTTYLALIT